jgi:hypothetical protein
MGSFVPVSGRLISKMCYGCMGYENDTEFLSDILMRSLREPMGKLEGNNKEDFNTKVLESGMHSTGSRWCVPVWGRIFTKM